MPRYRLEEAHFLGNKHYEGGAIVDWDGPPSSKMTPVEKIAEQRKAEFDAGRPHGGRSRDLPPRAASLRYDPNARIPGQPRVAGPPGQVHAVSADPANPERTADLVEARREHFEQEETVLDEALKPEPKDKAEDKAATASPKPATKKSDHDSKK